MPPHHNLPDDQRTALVILDSVRRLRNPVGRQKLAQILKGATALPAQPIYSRTTYYGRLASFAQSGIENLIDQLLEQGYLQTGGMLSGTRGGMLSLTPKGESAIREIAIISIELPPPVRERVLRERKATQASKSTHEQTAQLLAEGLKPFEIAQRRKISLNTIYNHLADLIAEGKVDVQKVVPPRERQLIEAAIQKIGTLDYLAPIKAILPTDIEYGAIRCVLEAWKYRYGHTTGEDSTKLSVPE